MELYGVAIVVIALAVFYILGLMTANWYNDKSERERQYALEKQYLRLKAGSDYYDPVGSYVSRCRYTQKGFTPAQLDEFEARMRNNGSATVMFNPTTKEKEK